MHSPLSRTSIPLALSLFLSACSAATLLPPDHRLPDGSTHSGETRDGFFHGEGVQEFPDGRVYKGDFRDGYWHGEGELAGDDWRYEGEFRQGRMSGQGVMTRGDRHYDGQFRQGDFHGEGRLESDQLGVIKGTFADGKPVKATQKINDGEYRGEFRDWQWHGEGRWRDAEGGVYKGTFVQGQLTGKGTYKGPNGKRYEGEFRNFRFHGEGVLTRADGTRLETSFRFGQPAGEGVLHRPDENGEVKAVDGRWTNGDFVPAGEPSPREQRRAINERILQHDAERLRQQLDGLADSRPGETDLYFLGVGGDGSESVFRRDLDVAYTTLDTAFGLRDRSLRLLNDREYQQFPLATRPSIKEALQRLDEVMNPREDLLFIHLTSHGGRRGQLKLHQPGLGLPNMTPAAFRRALNKLDIRHKAIVVSACFAGHWVDALEAPDTLVMTASRNDRPAMGCGEDSEMTWFTRALYEDTGRFGLNEPRAMFQRAKEQIHAWETERDVPGKQRAHPQFHLGEQLKPYLRDAF
jgi:hypothetical protein